MVRREARNGEIQGKSLLAATKGIVLNFTKNGKKTPKPIQSWKVFSLARCTAVFLN